MANRKTTTLTVSLPPEMAEALEAVRRAEHRTRSELVREALRLYPGFIRLRAARLPTEEATQEDLAAMEEGRREIERGDYVTLNQLRDELDLDHQPLGSEEPSKVSS